MEKFEINYNKSYLDGNWVDGDTGHDYDILNPYDDSVIATVQLASLKQVKNAYEIAEARQKEWAHSSVEERKEIFRKAAEFMQIQG